MDAPPAYETVAGSSRSAEVYKASQNFPSSGTTRGKAKHLESLHHAAETGDLVQIEMVLSSAAWDEREYLLNEVLNGELPLHCAARGAHLEILEMLLPEDFPRLSNAQCQNGGWSPLHFAAAYNHASIVQWLLISRTADMNLQDNGGNTPTHLAVALGQKDVVRYLVGIAGADISILNQDKMMPMSFCSDKAMFEALLPAYLPGSASQKKAGTDYLQKFWAPDGDGRSILQYAAQFSRDPHALARLIMQLGPDILDENRDNEGDSFLHVAARSGNMCILVALERVGSIRPDISKLITDSGSNPERSPALYALLHSHRDFFDKFTIMGKDVGITLKYIIGALRTELQKDSLMDEDRLNLFADTLPTYLALYAEKDCIFEFLLQTKLITLTQWDSKHHRTCLHWAVLDKRADIIQKLCEYSQVRPGILDGDGKTALQHAFEQNNQKMMDMMRARPGFKEYEEKLYRDRDVYVQALNAILVGAALIASVAFAGWLQWPSTADFKSLKMKIFWASNSCSFLTAVATMCVTTSALIPTPHRYMGDIVNRLQFAIVMDAGLLAISIAAATCAFVSVGFAATESSRFAYHAIMTITTAVAGCLAFMMWLGFVMQVYRCTPPRDVLFSILAPSQSFVLWLLRVLRWPELVKSSGSVNPGYSSLTSGELKALMNKDLAKVIRSETPNQNEDGLKVTKGPAAASHIMAQFWHKQLSSTAPKFDALTPIF